MSRLFPCESPSTGITHPTFCRSSHILTWQCYLDNGIVFIIFHHLLNSLSLQNINPTANNYPSIPNIIQRLNNLLMRYFTDLWETGLQSAQRWVKQKVLTAIDYCCSFRAPDQLWAVYHKINSAILCAGVRSRWFKLCKLLQQTFFIRAGWALV